MPLLYPNRPHLTALALAAGAAVTTADCGRPTRADAEAANINVQALQVSDIQSVSVTLAEIVALTHHEKWDGSGYPRGLKGEDIPLVGRIVAICDVFDALTVHRPYKLAFPLDRAYSTLRQGSGSHFDPAVVHAFFGAQSEVLRAYHQYGDDSPERPLPPAVVAARVAHPSAPHLVAVDASAADE